MKNSVVSVIMLTLFAVVCTGDLSDGYENKEDVEAVLEAALGAIEKKDTYDNDMKGDDAFDMNKKWNIEIPRIPIPRIPIPRIPIPHIPIPRIPIPRLPFRRIQI